MTTKHTKHTPAPWTMDVDAEGDPEAFSIWFDEGGTGAEIAGRICEEANARLIAAAPEMLEILREIEGTLDWILDTVESSGVYSELEKVRAILKKVEG